MTGLAHAVGLAVGDHGGGVVQQPVEHGYGGGVLGQEPSPGLEGPVGRDPERSAFVGGRDEPEDQLCAGVVQGCESELVDLCRPRDYAEESGVGWVTASVGLGIVAG